MSQNTPSDHDDETRPFETPADTDPPQPAAAPAASEPAKKPLHKRGSTWAIAGGGILAALVLVGGGAALGAALSDDGPDGFDGPRVSDSRELPGGPGGDERGPGRDDDRGPAEGPGGGTGPGTGPSAEAGAADAATLTGIVAKASAVSDVQGVVTRIETRRGGDWEVRFETGTSETEVLVPASGDARVVRTETDDDDSAPANALDDATVDAIVRAALAEADGTILEVEADDDTASPYEATLRLTDGGRMEIELGADFSVVSTDTRA
jgi:hypothetical protein